MNYDPKINFTLTVSARIIIVFLYMDRTEGKDRNRTIKHITMSPVVIYLIVAGLAIGLYVLRMFLIRSAHPRSTKPVTLGSHVINVIPGKTGAGNYLLPDGETRILFGHTGTDDAVPDVVFGQDYDYHNENYLPIKKEVSFYNKGYFTSLKNLGCDTETRHTDIDEVWVTDCLIQVTSRMEDAPIKKLETFDKVFRTNTEFKGTVTQTNNPFIYVNVPSLSLQYSSTSQSPEDLSLKAGGMTYYLPSEDWYIKIISSYGIETIRYSAQEIWQKETKQVTLGALTSTSTIEDLDCNAVYTKNRCEVTVRLTFSQDKTNQSSIKLASFSQ